MYREYKSNVHPNSKYHSLLGIYPVWLGSLTALSDFECKPRVLDDFFIIFVAEEVGFLGVKAKNLSSEKMMPFFCFQE